MYGLIDASLQWYQKVKTTMLRLKGHVSKIDQLIFYWFDKEGLYGILAVHVDDFLWAGSNKFQKDIISRIRSIFKVGKEATSPFKYIGLNLSQEEMCIMLTQKDYINNITEVKLDKREKMAHLFEEEKIVLSVKLCQLLWISKQSWPDIAFGMTDLAGRINTSTVEDLKSLNKIIKRVKSNHVSLKFQSLGKNLEIYVFMDASSEICMMVATKEDIL